MKKTEKFSVEELRNDLPNDLFVSLDCLHKNSTGFGFRLTKFRKAMLSNQQVYDVGKVVLSCLRIEKEISVSDAY